MVLGLQGYLVLTTYSVETSLGMLGGAFSAARAGAGGRGVAVCRAGRVWR